MSGKGKNGLIACPCCGYATLGEVAGYEICPICCWEDDGQDDSNADEIFGGPNPVSLTQARMNFIQTGSSHHKRLGNVRRPIESDERLKIYALIKVLYRQDNVVNTF